MFLQKPIFSHIRYEDRKYLNEEIEEIRVLLF